ncbi:MAG TPA: flagellar hook-length control protein FliK [Rheinheimera sp.]|nr:flagellar hook-length control protein FliK [Rheinheimera sp.]
MMPILRQPANAQATVSETSVSSNMAAVASEQQPEQGYSAVLQQLARQQSSSAALLPTDTTTMLVDAETADTTAVSGPDTSLLSAMLSGTAVTEPAAAADLAAGPVLMPADVMPAEAELVEAAKIPLLWQYAAPVQQATPATIPQPQPIVPATSVDVASGVSALDMATGRLSAAITPGLSSASPGSVLAAQRQQLPVNAAPAPLPQSLPPMSGDAALPQQHPGQNSTVLLQGSSLQQFIRQALGQTQSADVSAAGSVAGSAVSTSAQSSSEPVFSWKAELSGQHSSQWGQKLVHLLADKINLQLGQQIQRAQIRLDPPQLGVIELSVSVDGERTSVQLYAANAQLRDAMQQNVDLLRQQLSQRLGNEQLLDIDVRQQSQQQSGKHSAAAEQIAAQYSDETAELSAAGATQTITGWLNRLV